MTVSIRIQAESFDVAAETAALTEGRTDIGAVVAFTGLCRDEEGRLSALELEHYPGMAEAEIDRIAAQAQERWPLLGVTVVHRFGTIRPGDEIGHGRDGRGQLHILVRPADPLAHPGEIDEPHGDQSSSIM